MVAADPAYGPATAGHRAHGRPLGAASGTHSTRDRSQLEAPADDPDRPVLDPEWLDLFLGDKELFFDLRDHRVNRLVLIPTLFVAGVAAAGVVLLGGLI